MKQALKFLALSLATAAITSPSLWAAEVSDPKQDLILAPAPENDLDPVQDWILSLTRPQIDQATEISLSCKNPTTVEGQINARQLTCDTLKKSNLKPGFAIQCAPSGVVIISSVGVSQINLCRDGKVQTEALSWIQLPPGFGLYVEGKAGTGEHFRLVPNPLKSNLGLGLKTLVFDKGNAFDLQPADLATLKGATASDAAFRLVASPQKLNGQDLTGDRKSAWVLSTLAFLESQTPPKWALLASLAVASSTAKDDSMTAQIGREVLLRINASQRQSTIAKDLCKEFDSWVLARQILLTEPATPLPSRVLEFDCQLQTVKKALLGPTVQLTRLPLPLKAGLVTSLPFRTLEDMRSPAVLQALVKVQ
jgi:hypothetical protein